MNSPPPSSLLCIPVLRTWRNRGGKKKKRWWCPLSNCAYEPNAAAVKVVVVVCTRIEKRTWAPLAPAYIYSRNTSFSVSKFFGLFPSRRYFNRGASSSPALRFVRA